MRDYWVMEIRKLDPAKHTKEAHEFINVEPTYRQATWYETAMILEQKLKKMEKQMETLKQYVGNDMIESIRELENELNNNTICKEEII